MKIISFLIILILGVSLWYILMYMTYKDIKLYDTGALYEDLNGNYFIVLEKNMMTVTIASKNSKPHMVTIFDFIINYHLVTNN